MSLLLTLGPLLHRSSSCLYHASLTILIANNLTVSQHHLYHNVTLDMREIDRSLVILDSLLAGCDLLLTSHGSVKELNKRSKRAVKEYAARVLIAEVLPTPAPF